MKIAYKEWRPDPSSLKTVEQANAIISQYMRQGFDLTLRQLYYQFVKDGLIANQEREYKRLGRIISDARLAGMLDWDIIVDRTRGLKGNTNWLDPANIIEAAANSFRMDRWAN